MDRFRACWDRCFLLAPLGLIALRRREGRQLWLAALVFGANYFSNISARFLIPPLPFVALAMMLALSAVPQLAVAVAALSAVALLAGDCAALRPSGCVAPGRNSVARGAAPPARRSLPGAASHALPSRPVDRAKHRARFHGVYLRADSGSLYIAPHPGGIPIGVQPGGGEDSVDGARTGIRAHLAAAFPLSAPNTARAARGANQSRRGYLEHPRIPHLPGRYRSHARAHLAVDAPNHTHGAYRMRSTIPSQPSGCAARP